MNRGPEVNWRRQPVNAKCMHDIYDAVTTRGSGTYAAVTTAIWFRFDSSSTGWTFDVPMVSSACVCVCVCVCVCERERERESK